jgi:hypothetical protein
LHKKPIKFNTEQRELLRLNSIEVMRNGLISKYATFMARLLGVAEQQQTTDIDQELIEATKRSFSAEAYFCFVTLKSKELMKFGIAKLDISTGELIPGSSLIFGDKLPTETKRKFRGGF